MSDPQSAGDPSIPRSPQLPQPTAAVDDVTQANDLPGSQALRRKTLLALLDASRAMAAELNMPAVLQRMAEQAARVFHCQGASVLLYNPSGHELQFVAATGPGSDKLQNLRFDASLGIAGHALRTGRAVHVDDVQGHDSFFEGIDARTHIKTRSLMACPLIHARTHADQPLGVIEVLNPLDREHFDKEDLQLLEIFANMAAVAASNAKSFEELDQQNTALRHIQPRSPMVGNAPAMLAVMELCKTVAAATTTVLLTGETGTGKEMAAREIHKFSPRKNKPFVAINCAAIAESLLESELFGHEKGAFTGASSKRQGRFELASGGTLLLDEIGEMSPNLQVKLLRVLQERCFERVGGSQTLTTDVRVIAATNRNLITQINKGAFREDLYYRLAVFPIHLPPLRQRIDDLKALIDVMLVELCPSLGLTKATISPEALDAMRQYAWPGNVRELRNVVERSALLSKGHITPQWLPTEINARKGGLNATQDVRSPGSTPAAIPNKNLSEWKHGSLEAIQPPDVPAKSPMGSRLVDQEKNLLFETLEQHQWNQSAAARALGISRDVLRYRVKKHGLSQS